MIRADLPATAPLVDSLASEVRHYLEEAPRQLPSRALYDALGSALFNAICELPWYPVTRAERRLIATQRDAVFEVAGKPGRLVELGCGNGEKLALLLDRRRHGGDHIRRIDLVDVSASALHDAARRVSDTHDAVVITHQEPYERGLASAAASRASGERALVLFLGSNIGNFDPPGADVFLSEVRRHLRPGDALLLGADLVKPAHELLLAYDDPLGVTAAFNKNLLVRLNRELGATFDIAQFDHRAVWNKTASRVEMHLVSRVAQRVVVPQSGLAFELAAGETIWTESSYKYTQSGVDAMLQRAGFVPARHWLDEEGQFLLVVAIA